METGKTNPMAALMAMLGGSPALPKGKTAKTKVEQTFALLPQELKAALTKADKGKPGLLANAGKSAAAQEKPQSRSLSPRATDTSIPAGAFETLVQAILTKPVQQVKAGQDMPVWGAPANKQPRPVANASAVSAGVKPQASAPQAATTNAKPNKAQETMTGPVAATEDRPSVVKASGIPTKPGVQKAEAASVRQASPEIPAWRAQPAQPAQPPAHASHQPVAGSPAVPAVAASPAQPAAAANAAQAFGKAQGHQQQGVHNRPAAKTSGEQATPSARNDHASLGMDRISSAIEAGAQVGAGETSRGVEASAPANHSGPATPAQAEQPLLDQVAGAMRNLRGEEGEQVVIRLHPPQLGQVRVTLEAQGSAVRGILELDNVQALGELQRQTPALMQRLAEAGIDLRRMDFVLNDQTGDNSQGASQWAAHSQSGRHDGQGEDRQAFAFDGQDPEQMASSPRIESAAELSTAVADGVINLWI